MPKITNEFKTGLMLIIVVAIVIYFVYAAGGPHVSKGGYEVTVTFDFISGLRKNAPVKLGGAEVGYVKDIQILCNKEQTQIVVTLWVDAKAKIRTDSEFRIMTAGLMGEKFIEISPGGKSIPFLKPATTVAGINPFELELQADIIANNLNDVLLEIKKLSKHADDIVTKEEIDNILKNLEATSANFEAFSEDLKKHPWKLIWKTKEKKADKKESSRRTPDEEDEKTKGIEFKKGVIQ